MNRREFKKKLATGVISATALTAGTTGVASAISCDHGYYGPDDGSFGSSDSAWDSFAEVCDKGDYYTYDLVVRADLGAGDYPCKDKERIEIDLEKENYEAGLGYYYTHVDSASVSVSSEDTEQDHIQGTTEDYVTTGKFRVRTQAHWHFRTTDNCYPNRGGYYDGDVVWGTLFP